MPNSAGLKNRRLDWNHCTISQVVVKSSEHDRMSDCTCLIFVSASLKLYTELLKTQWHKVLFDVLSVCFFLFVCLFCGDFYLFVCLFSVWLVYVHSVYQLIFDLKILCVVMAYAECSSVPMLDGCYIRVLFKMIYFCCFVMLWLCCAVFTY